MSRTEHERCSELLAPYLDEALDERESAWMTAHLDSCPECRVEMAGLAALRAQEPALNDVERARLHRDVFYELGLMTGEAKPARRWSQRAPQLLGAVATVALLLGGLVYLGNGLGGGDDSAESIAGGDSDAGQGAEAFDSLEAGDGAATGGAAPGAERATDLPEPEANYESDLGTVENRSLKKLGRRSRTFKAFTGVEVAAAEELRSTFLDSLVDQAPPDTSVQLRECATEVLNQLPRAVATYAAPARYGDPPRPVLVIGFAYSFTEQGFLDQYQLWIYPRGSCDFPMNYLGGQIRP